MVHLLQPAALPHSGGSPAVHRAGFALTSFAGPLQTVTWLVRGPGGPDVLILFRPGQFLSGAELQSFRRRGASAIVEDLGCREYVHDWLDFCGFRRSVRGRPLSDVVSLVPYGPSYMPGPHWSALMTVPHWPMQGSATPLLHHPDPHPNPTPLLSFPHLCGGVVSHSVQQCDGHYKKELSSINIHVKKLNVYFRFYFAYFRFFLYFNCKTSRFLAVAIHILSSTVSKNLY